MATLQNRSAFNLRGCQPIGGQALETTSSSCDSDVLENIYEQVKQAAKDYRWEAERTTLRAKLTYNCPKVGDAVRWDPSIQGFNLAYAMFDTNNPTDQEHLIEVVGVVESVSVTCDGSPSEINPNETNTNAVIVTSGKVSFDQLKLESQLDEGKVYYLWDRNHPSHVALGNNVSADTHEPVISKPLFVSTGTHTALVLNYRPLTGSPTGGRPQTEKYEIEILKTAKHKGGWEVTIRNIGGIASRHPLVAQIDYNRRTGPRASLNGKETHTMFKNLGVLHNKVVAGVTSTDTLESEITFYVTVDSEFGIEGGISDNIEDGINGVGEITVTLKSNTSNTQSSSLLKSLIPFQTSPTARRFPNISINGECAYASESENTEEQDENNLYKDGNNPNIPDKVVSPSGVSTAYSFEGVIFEITLDKDSQNNDIYVPMADELYFKIESPSLQEPIINKFFLDQSQTAVEIIPVSETGEGITKENVTLSIITADGESLNIKHWGKTIQQSSYICDSQRCCDEDKISVDCMALGDTNAEAKLEDLMISDGDSKFMTSGPNNSDITTKPRLYTQKPYSDVSLNSGSTNETLRATFKNARENTIFCYPNTVKTGTQPSFMAIYFNEARSGILGSRGAKDYDPRYIAIEIGGQNTLNNAVVTITLNSGQPNECCIDFKFDGSEVGTHYTFREMYQAGLVVKRASNSDTLFGIEDGV
jgi:hypothetical protein